jgi:predicted nucleic acid-binding protein
MSAADRVFFDTNVQEKWQISFWDALILAAAERSRCVTVWSEDLSSGQTYGAVRVMNPFAPAVPRLHASPKLQR